MKITRFEDIEAWRASRGLLRQIEELTRDRTFRRDADLRSQLRRAARSAMANIAEGFNSGTDEEFTRFLRTLDQGVITQSEFDRIYGGAEEVKKLIGGFVRYLTNAKNSLRLRTEG